MIGQGVKPLALQPKRDFFGFFAGHTIDDPGMLLMPILQKTQQLRSGVVFECDTVVDIGSIKAGNKLSGPAQIQSHNNFGACARVRCGGKGYPWNIGEVLMQKT